MKNDIGIGIIDIYNDKCFEDCYSSIPDEYKSSTVVVSNKQQKNNIADKTYDKEVPFATLRNYIISQLRMNDKRYFFILNSNCKIKNSEVFDKTIKIAKSFGTWFMTGPSEQGLVKIEDDEEKLCLNLTPVLNTDFLFMYSGMFKNFKFFEERYFNSYDLDVLDYILRMRERGVYPPKHYNPTIDLNDIEFSKSKNLKIGFKTLEDLRDNSSKTLDMAVAYFYHKHRYIPQQNDPNGVKENELLEFMENLQKTYGAKD